MLRRALLIIILLSATLTAAAQRTAYGERKLSLSGAWTISSAGGEFQYGQYLMTGYWLGALNFANRVELDSPTWEYVYYPHVELAGGYMFRIFGSRSRAINIYAGADVFVGLEMFDLWNTLTSPTHKAFIESGFTNYRFIYGPAARMETEFFISNSVAITINGRIPICLNTKFDILGFELGAGVTLNF